MSYGVWKKHGKGWSSIEIDSPHGNRPLYRYELEPFLSYRRERKVRPAYKRLVAGCESHGVRFDDSSNVDHLKWEVGQRSRYRGRTIISFWPGGGEHKMWIAFDDKDSLARAVEKLHRGDWSELSDNLSVVRYGVDHYEHGVPGAAWRHDWTDLKEWISNGGRDEMPRITVEKEGGAYRAHAPVDSCAEGIVAHGWTRDDAINHLVTRLMTVK